MERRLALFVAFCWASAGRGLVAPPELAATAELLLVGKERSRYDELFELEMAVSAKARRVDEHEGRQRSIVRYMEDRTHQRQIPRRPPNGIRP